ncbi:MAG: protein kinase domain-containing protein, partial [Micromonosporaceae bacterium]
ALHAAHSAGIVHRDIKPGNLVIAADGTVKVLDFGIALLQDAANQASLTRAATVVGTSHYMAPEQASGGSADARTDLYALGCVLYAMLTGQPPFNGENSMAVLYQHLHQAPAPVRELRPETPVALQTLLGSLLAKDPGQRPATAAAVRSTLTELAESGFTPGADATSPMGQPAASTQPGGTSVMPVGRAAVPPPAAAPTSTDHFPEQLGSRRAPIGSRGAVVGASVAAAVVLMLIVWALLPDSGQQTATPPSTSPEQSTAAPSSASPDSTEPTATTPSGRLVELRALLNQLTEDGKVDAEVARKLNEEISKIGEEISKGDLSKASEKVAEVRKKVDEEAAKNLIDPDAYEELSDSLDRLAQVLPSEEGDEQG